MSIVLRVTLRGWIRRLLGTVPKRDERYVALLREMPGLESLVPLYHQVRAHEYFGPENPIVRRIDDSLLFGKGKLVWLAERLHLTDAEGNFVEVVEPKPPADDTLTVAVFRKILTLQEPDRVRCVVKVLHWRGWGLGSPPQVALQVLKMPKGVTASVFARRILDPIDEALASDARERAQREAAVIAQFIKDLQAD